MNSGIMVMNNKTNKQKLTPFSGGFYILGRETK